jgi:hypothetical protein
MIWKVIQERGKEDNVGDTGEVAMPCGSKSRVRELSSISVYHIYVC